MTAVVELRGVRHGFGGGPQLLAGVEIEVRPGEIVAIVGRSGEGKSTLLSVMGLLLRPDAGEVLVEGRSTSGLADAGRARIRRRACGFVFQNYSLIAARTAAENVALPFDLGGRPPGWRRLVAEALAEVGLADRARARPRELSGGEQQRVAIARALVAAPSMVLADEPTGSLDAGSGDAVIELMMERARVRNTAVVVVTHDEAVARRADRVLQLRAGRLRCQ